MSQLIDTRLMPAQNTTQNPSQKAGQEGEGVTPMLSKRPERARAWDELSEVDRVVLLQAVKLRREARERRRNAYRGLRADLRHLR